jgi:protein-S-isoprenylcysteine O-methyltransferase Ste14
MGAGNVVAVSSRHWSDVLLFSVTCIELGVLLILTPTLALPDWIYVLQHVMVLVIALTRRPPAVQDHSLGVSAAVAVSYGYPYAQVIYLQRVSGSSLWPEGGMVLIVAGALLSIASLWTLGRRFGIRPALRGLTANGPYRVVRHPMYLSYVLSDIGYNLQEYNVGTVSLVILGWVAMIVRIEREERVMAHHQEWSLYTNAVGYRLVPGLW